MRPGSDTLRDAQDPDNGQWAPLTRITLERFNLIFAQQHSRSYASDGQPQHDCAACLEDGKAILCKVALVDGDLLFSKWSVASGLEYDDVVIVAAANISSLARPSLELVAGAAATIRCFYIGDDANIHYVESVDGGANFGAEQNVGALANAKAIASVSTTRIHAISYTSGNTRFHTFEYDGSWSETDSLIYWPHLVSHIDAITIGDRDLVVLYSPGPMYGKYLEAGIYGIWVEHGRWSDIFKIDVLDEADDYAYRQHPMISTANEIYFLTGYLREGDEDYSHQSRFLKTSKDGQNWSQYMPLVTCPEAGPAKLLVVNAAVGESWPWDTGQQVYLAGYDKVYESDATRLVGEINTALQVDVTSRTQGWQLERGAVSIGNTILSNHDGGLDNHAIINADNTLLLIREAGYHTEAGDELAQVTLEAVDFIKETDKLPQRHKQVASRDFMAWVRDREAGHFEYWESQLVGYDNYADDTETGYGGLGHTATQKGWWETKNNVLWLRSNNEMGLAFATWDSKIMNGQVKSMIRIETAGNDEYAGVVFRAKDEGNFWAAYYDEATDKIILRQRYGDSWLSIAAQSSGALGWSIDTYYGIMVDFRYGYVRVFRSTDGNAWTLDFTHVIIPNALNPSPEYGYAGLIGYGYSSEDEEEAPGYTPPLPGSGPDDLGLVGPAVAGHSIDGLYVTDDRGESWTQKNTGLASTDMLDLIWDPWWFTSERQGSNDPDDVILWACGVGWVERRVGAADWEDMTPGNDPPNSWGDATAPTASTVTYKQLHGDIHNLDTFYALAEWQEVDSGTDKWRGWIAKTETNGLSWTWYPLKEDFGAELVVNGTFDTDCSSWSKCEADGVYWHDSQRLRFRFRALSDTYSGQNITVPSDGTYRLKATWDRNPPYSNVARVSVGGSIKLTWAGPDETGARTTDIALTAGIKALQLLNTFYGPGGTYGYWDNVSVRQLLSTTQFRPLAFDVDTENGTRVYVTGWADGTLECRQYDSSLALVSVATFGSATESEVADKTYFIVPRCPHVTGESGFGEYVYAFGRYNDGAIKHLAKSEDGGGSFTNKGSASWDLNHRIGALEVLYDNTVLYAIVNHATTPRLWTSPDAGVTWSNLNSVPFNVEFEALTRCTWSEDEEFLIGSNAAGAMMAAWLESPYTGDWTDATGSPGLPTGAGAIPAIIWV